MTIRGPLFAPTYILPPPAGLTFAEIPARIPPPKKPFNQTDFPNPVPPAPPGLTWISQRTPASIPPPNRPKNQTDFPNPVPPFRIEQTAINDWLVLNKSPLPNNQYDWPNPVPPFRIEQTWIKTPEVIPPPVQGFNQYSWPNPVPPSRLDETWTNPGINSSVQNPFSQTSWPITILPVSTFTWIQSPPTIPPPNKPFNTTDFPLPGQPYRIEQTWIEQGPSLTSFQTNPFFQTNWPNPASQLTSGLTWIQTPVVIPPPNQPFNTYDWPVPTPPSKIEQTWIIPHTLINPPLPIPAGSNYDWPNPRDGRDYRGYTFSEYPGSTPPPVQPFNQYIWPVPASQPRPEVSFTSGPIPNTLPFNQSAWPLGLLVPYPGQTFLNPGIQSTPVVLPFNQTDFPNPRAYTPISGTWINPGIEQVVSVPLPFNVYDWQVYLDKLRATDFIPPNLALVLTPVLPPVGPQFGGREFKSRWQEGMEHFRNKTPDHVSIAAKTLGKAGGHARAAALTGKQRSSIASIAAQTRWTPPKGKR